MTETKIYVGLNDVVSKHQVHFTEKYVKVMKYVCMNYHVSFSYVITEGGYFHEDGDYVEEQTLVITLIDSAKSVSEAVAKELCALFHQEKVLITESMVRSSYVMEEL